MCFCNGNPDIAYCDKCRHNEKPHFDFSRTPNSEKAERALQANLAHIKMMTEHGKSRYIHGCYTEEDAKNVVAHFHANPQLTKELHIKSYEQSGSNVYIFYKKRAANDWHEQGELPPVGVECEIFPSYPRAKITYMGNGVGCCIDLSNGMEYTFATSSYTFRPLKTERERAIEEMCKAIDSNDETEKYNLNIDCSAALRFAIEALYDAGYRKGEK